MGAYGVQNRPPVWAVRAFLYVAVGVPAVLVGIAAGVAVDVISRKWPEVVR